MNDIIVIFADCLVTDMAGALVQSTSFPSSVAGERIAQPSRSGKGRTSRRTVKMMCTVHNVPSRVRGFSGLRGANALDMIGKSGQSFHSKVAASTSVQRGRATRIAPKAMFERFTEKAIKVIMLAQEEARRLGHNFVGTEQILLGLIGEGTGIAAKVLKSMGINLKDARVEVEKIIGRGSGFVAVEIPFTPRAKRVLELSLEEARQLGSFTNLFPCLSAVCFNHAYFSLIFAPTTPILVINTIGPMYTIIQVD